MSDVELVSRGGFHSNLALTSVPLPAGTKRGDLIVAMGCGPNTGGHNPPLPPGSMTDPRMTGHYAHIAGDDWWGIATDLTPLQVTISDGDSLVVGVFGPSSGRLALGPAITATKSDNLGNGSDPIPIPSINERAVVICCTKDVGYVTAPPLFIDYIAGPAEGELLIEWWTGVPPSPADTYIETIGYQVTDRSVSIIPVILEPRPIRQFPRDDQLGYMGSAPRLFPQPKQSQRLVGGMQ